MNFQGATVGADPRVRRTICQPIALRLATTAAISGVLRGMTQAITTVTHLPQTTATSACKISENKLWCRDLIDCEMSVSFAVGSLEAFCSGDLGGNCRLQKTSTFGFR